MFPGPPNRPRLAELNWAFFQTDLEETPEGWGPEREVKAWGGGFLERLG